MYASPVTSTTSQLSQPSSSTSARVVGRNGATPNRSAQYDRYENRPRADIAATVSTPADRVATGLLLRRGGAGAVRRGRGGTGRYWVGTRWRRRTGGRRRGSACRGRGELRLLIADQRRLLLVGQELGARRGVLELLHRDQALRGLRRPAVALAALADQVAQRIGFLRRRR